MSKETEIRKGLDGVLADESAVSKVMSETNSLTYRGYPVQDLADQCNFEEVAYLLQYGELPSQGQLDAFSQEERKQRPISENLHSVICHFPSSAHPMDALQIAVNFLAMEDTEGWNHDEASLDKITMKLLAKLPTVLAAIYRNRKGEKPIAPDANLSFSENFFQMCFGKVPDPAVIKAFDVSLTLYAEHGFNASTFTGRVISSTLSDMYSAVSGAIGALKGPLHGGANEAVMHMLLDIGDPAKAQAWLLKALKEKRKVMGFGHRVYRSGDSRVPTMKKYMLKMVDYTGEKRWAEILEILEQTMIKEKGIYPNLDFPAGPAYYMMGFDIDIFTPIFVISRITGWCAHIKENLAANRLIRPLCQYVGPEQRTVVLLDSRR
jgi:2-methylcitrate synthase